MELYYVKLSILNWKHSQSAQNILYIIAIHMSKPKVSELMERRNLLVISLKKFVGGGLYDYSVTPGSGLVKSQK